jgi:metal-responsive CopG/Arc/MetJ family transcriptional regulator
MTEITNPVLSARVEKTLHERIDALSEKTGVSRAEVINRALAIGLSDQEKFVKQVQGTFSGPLMELAMNKKFLDVMLALSGDEADPIQVQVVKNVRESTRRRTVRGTPAVP